MAAGAGCTPPHVSFWRCLGHRRSQRYPTATAVQKDQRVGCSPRALRKTMLLRCRGEPWTWHVRDSALASEALNGPAATGQHVDEKPQHFGVPFRAQVSRILGVPSMIMAAWGTGDRGVMGWRGGMRWEAGALARWGRWGRGQGQDQDLRQLRTWYHDPWVVSIQVLCHP